MCIEHRHSVIRLLVNNVLLLIGNVVYKPYLFVTKMLLAQQRFQYQHVT